MKMLIKRNSLFELNFNFFNLFFIIFLEIRRYLIFNTLIIIRINEIYIFLTNNNKLV